VLCGVAQLLPTAYVDMRSWRSRRLFREGTGGQVAAGGHAASPVPYPDPLALHSASLGPMMQMHPCPRVVRRYGIRYGAE
jgi:hypothetical protein